MDRGASMIWHLSAAVEVLEQAVYAAEAKRDPVELSKRDEVEKIVGRVQSVIAGIEAEKAMQERENALYSMMEGEVWSLNELRTYLDSHNGTSDDWIAGVRAIERIEREAKA